MLSMEEIGEELTGGTVQYLTQMAVMEGFDINKLSSGDIDENDDCLSVAARAAILILLELLAVGSKYDNFDCEVVRCLREGSGDDIRSLLTLLGFKPEQIGVIAMAMVDLRGNVDKYGTILDSILVRLTDGEWKPE